MSRLQTTLPITKKMATNSNKKQQQPAQTTTTAPKCNTDQYIGRLGIEGSDTIGGRNINLDVNNIDYGQGREHAPVGQIQKEIEQEKRREYAGKLEEQKAKADKAWVKAGNEQVRVGVHLQRFVGSVADYVEARERTEHKLQLIPMNREIRANDIATKTYEVKRSSTTKSNALDQLIGMGVAGDLEQQFQSASADKEVTQKQKAKA